VRNHVAVLVGDEIIQRTGQNIGDLFALMRMRIDLVARLETNEL
jgi:hypothetical protein